MWFFGRYGFVLSDPVKFDFVPYPGKTYLFDINYKDFGNVKGK